MRPIFTRHASRLPRVAVALDRPARRGKRFLKVVWVLQEHVPLSVSFRAFRTRLPCLSLVVLRTIQWALAVNTGRSGGPSHVLATLRCATTESFVSKTCPLMGAQGGHRFTQTRLRPEDDSDRPNSPHQSAPLRCCHKTSSSFRGHLRGIRCSMADRTDR
jgi:hypothetical protein